VSAEKGKQITKRNRQLELEMPARAADLTFFYMFSAEIQRGLVARLGTSAFAVWVVLRSYARLADGRVYLSLSDIHKATGLSVNTIRQAIATLEAEQLVQVMLDGKQKRRYFVVDLVPFKAVQGEDLTTALEQLERGQHDGTIALRYVPKTATRDRQEIAHWIQGGSAPASPNVQLVGEQKIVHQHVEHQHVHVHVHGGAAPTTQDELAPFIQTVLERARRTTEQREKDAKERDVVTVGRNPVNG
jgi:hypothetical protein